MTRVDPAFRARVWRRILIALAAFWLSAAIIVLHCAGGVWFWAGEIVL